MFFMKQISYDDEINLFLRILAFLMSRFSFFIINYMTSSVNSDLSTVDDPKSIKSLENVLEYDVQPKFVKGLPDADKFMYAAKGSMEDQIWNHAIKNGGDAHWLTPSFDSIVAVMSGFIKQKFVLITNKTGAKSLAQFACSMMRDEENIDLYHPELYALLVNNEYKVTTTSIIYKFDLDLDLRKALNKRLLGSIEFGTDKVWFKNLLNSFVPWSPE